MSKVEVQNALALSYRMGIATEALTLLIIPC